MLNSPRTLVIATAGHIDHGKTTLVRALTGIDTDRLPEEKRRGITIDLGFASMELAGPGAESLRISFVDVPGHSLFIRNMLAGAGCVPAVLLVVAADEGIKPQTIEHLAICELLGITDGIIAITKCDAVSSEHLDQLGSNIQALVGDTFLRNAPLLPVSARTREGLASLRDEFVNLAMRTQPGSPDSLLRFPIDRSFVMKGFGTVVTGTLLSGAIREGQLLALEPGGPGVRVRGVQTHGQRQPEACAGTRVAVNLSGIDAVQVHRGQTIVAPETLSAVAVIDAEIRLLASAPPLKHGARVHFHAFTSEGMASVSLYDYDDVRPGNARLARLKLDAPVVLVPGDRFVLRQPAPVATIGGGRVLDCHPELRQRKAPTRAWLELLKNAPIPEQLVLRIKRRGTFSISADLLSRQAGLTVGTTRHHLESALQAGDIALISDLDFISREGLQAGKEQVVTMLGRLASKSGLESVKSSALRSQASLPPVVFDFLVADLVRAGKLQSIGEDLSPAAGPAPSSRDSAQLAAIAQAYQEAGLAAPLVPELAQRFRLSEADVRRFVTLLQRQKVIVRMGSDNLFMHARSLEELASRMISFRGKLIDVAAFKQFTGLSRKYAIPLLEHLDHARITRKQGDKRLVL